MHPLRERKIKELKGIGLVKNNIDNNDIIKINEIVTVKKPMPETMQART